MKELPKIVAETEVGKKVNVKIWRNKKEISKQIILGRLETSDDFAAQGIKPEVPKNSYIDELKITGSGNWHISEQFDLNILVSNINLQTLVQLLDLDEKIPPSLSINGRLNTDFHLGGTLTNPYFKVTYNQTKIPIRINQSEVDIFGGEVIFDKKRLFVGRPDQPIRIKIDKNQLLFDLEIGESELSGQRPINGRFDLQTRDLGILPSLFPQFGYANGIGYLNLTLGGYVSNPKLKGMAKFQKVQVSLPDQRVNIKERDIDCKAIVLLRDPVDRIKSAVRYNLDRENYDEGIKIGETDFLEDLEQYYKSEHCTIRTRYDKTIEIVRGVFDEEDIYIGIYEEMFESDKIDDVSKFFGIQAKYDFASVRVNKTKSATTVNHEIEQNIKNFYSEVYEYCNEEFPSTRNLWR